MAHLLHRELTDVIIAAYYEVYNHTLRIYPESVFERAMIVELAQKGYQATQQPAYRVLYKGQLVGIQQLDLLLLNEVVVENKVAARLTPRHFAQGISYLRTVGKQVGLVLNFGSPTPEFKRLYFDPNRQRLINPPSNLSQTSEHLLFPELAYQIVGGLHEVHNELGVGFINRIYANASYRELQMRGLTVQPQKRIEVIYKGTTIGDVAFGHLLVDNKIMVFPAAYEGRRIVDLEVLRSWMHTRNIQLGILANFQASQLITTFLRL